MKSSECDNSLECAGLAGLWPVATDQSGAGPPHSKKGPIVIRDFELLETVDGLNGRRRRCSLEPGSRTPLILTATLISPCFTAFDERSLAVRDMNVHRLVFFPEVEPDPAPQKFDPRREVSQSGAKAKV